MSVALGVPSPSQSKAFQAVLGVNVLLAATYEHPSFGSVPSAISCASVTPSPSVSSETAAVTVTVIVAVDEQEELVPVTE